MMTDDRVVVERRDNNRRLTKGGLPRLSGIGDSWRNFPNLMGEVPSAGWDCLLLIYRA
jgi:hypothetical protein